MIFRLKVTLDYQRGRLNGDNKRDVEQGLNFLMRKLDFNLTGKNIDPEESRCSFSLARNVNNLQEFARLEGEVVKMMIKWRASEARDLELFSYEVISRDSNRD